MTYCALSLSLSYCILSCPDHVRYLADDNAAADEAAAAVCPLYEFAPVAEFWRRQARLPTCQYPALVRLARKVLAAPATSVFSERLFSEFGLIYEERRSRLTPANGEKILFLHHNYNKGIDMKFRR
jgi:hypothetical protein